MTTVFDVLRDASGSIVGTRYGTASGGSTTTLIDTALIGEDSDWFNNGTVLFLSGTLINKSAVVTDFNGITGTLTFATQTGAVIAGVRYAIIPAQYSRELLVGGMNAALSALGAVLMADDTTDTVSGQEEYDLPAGVVNVLRVAVASNSDDPYGWKTNYHWRVVDDQLHFDSGFAPTSDGAVMRIIYRGEHGTVFADADVISPSVPAARLAAETMYFAVIAKMQAGENNEGSLKTALQMAAAARAEAAVRFPLPQMGRDVRLAGY